MDSVFESVFSAIDAVVYRCKNDADYTMETMNGGVEALLGYTSDDLIDNAMASYVSVVVDEDAEAMVAEIDAAIAANEAWDVTYRVTRKDGRVIWLRERGNAIHENGELTYLQGLLVAATAETALRDKLENTLSKTRSANKDIAGMADKIADSVRELSMLSINARIEAARTGEAGLGFAVVANEMKALADRNAEWAEVIAERISEMA